MSPRPAAPPEPPGSGGGKTPAERILDLRLRIPSGWSALHWISVLGVLTPLGALVVSLFGPAGRHWVYVRDHLLRGCLAETVFLTAASCLFAWTLGTVTAWLVSLHDFPGKRFFATALVLPLAIPPYLGAYAYDGLVGYTGLIQTLARNHLDLSLSFFGYWPPAGARAVWVFSLTLFPYVFLMTRAFLVGQGAALLENARLLGGGRLHMLMKVGLPLIIPASSSGAVLVALEVLNDFGVASHYGLSTFSTVIFNAWFGMGDPDTAIKLSMTLMLLVFVVLGLKAMAANLEKYHLASSRERPAVPKKIEGPRKWLPAALCAIVWLFAFAVPVLQLFYWLKLTYEEAFNAALAKAAVYTLATAASGALIVMIAALGSVNAVRLRKGALLKITGQAASLGYAIPSAVLAIGVIVVFVASFS